MGEVVLCCRWVCIDCSLHSVIMSQIWWKQIGWCLPLICCAMGHRCKNSGGNRLCAIFFSSLSEHLCQLSSNTMFAAPFVASSYEKSPPQAHHRLITGHLRHNHSTKIMFYSLHICKCNYIITKKYLYYSSTTYKGRRSRESSMFC